MATLDMVLIALLCALLIIAGLLYFYWADSVQHTLKERDQQTKIMHAQAKALALMSEAMERQHEELEWTRLKYAQEKLGADLITPQDLETKS